MAKASRRWRPSRPRADRPWRFRGAAPAAPFSFRPPALAPVLRLGMRPVRSPLLRLSRAEMLQDNRFLLWLAFVFSWGGVVIALVLQHGFDMQPCAWCNVQ